MATICVFCAASESIGPEHLVLAAEVGTELARRGHDLVTGGGSVSSMGAVSRAARAGGARTIGVIPEALLAYEVADTGSSYNVAYQHSAFFLLKPILPIWRIDLGLDLGPGFSRQVFRMKNGDKDFSQGFAFLIGPSIDFWVVSSMGMPSLCISFSHSRTS